MSECTHNCSTCGESCGERQEPQSLLKEHNPNARVGKVYGIVSGKGGVGKSMVTSQLAVTMRRRGYSVGVLDADVTGPSIPKAFGIHGQAVGNEQGLFPMESRTGIQIMSTNLLLANETDPVIWRGPVISGVVLLQQGLGLLAIAAALAAGAAVMRAFAHCLLLLFR